MPSKLQQILSSVDALNAQKRRADEVIDRRQERIDRLHEKKLNQHRKEIAELIRSLRVSCRTCGKSSPLKDYYFHQTHYDDHEAECWMPDEDACCRIICPQCKAECRIWDHAKSSEILAGLETSKLKKQEIFAKVYKSYGSHSGVMLIHPSR